MIVEVFSNDDIYSQVGAGLGAVGAAVLGPVVQVLKEILIQKSVLIIGSTQSKLVRPRQEKETNQLPRQFLWSRVKFTVS